MRILLPFQPGVLFSKGDNVYRCIGTLLYLVGAFALADTLGLGIGNAPEHSLKHMLIFCAICLGIGFPLSSWRSGIITGREQSLLISWRGVAPIPFVPLTFALKTHRNRVEGYKLLELSREIKVVSSSQRSGKISIHRPLFAYSVYKIRFVPTQDDQTSSRPVLIEATTSYRKARGTAERLAMTLVLPMKDVTFEITGVREPEALDESMRERESVNGTKLRVSSRPPDTRISVMETKESLSVTIPPARFNVLSYVNRVISLAEFGFVAVIAIAILMIIPVSNFLDSQGMIILFTGMALLQAIVVAAMVLFNRCSLCTVEMTSSELSIQNRLGLIALDTRFFLDEIEDLCLVRNWSPSDVENVYSLMVISDRKNRMIGQTLSAQEARYVRSLVKKGILQSVKINSSQN